MSNSDQTNVAIADYHLSVRKLIRGYLQTVVKREMDNPNSHGRTNSRFPVAVDVAYQLLGSSRILSAGRGRSVNISSGGVLLETDDSLPVGARIALQIAWPATIDKHVRLALHVQGHTLRSEGIHTAVTIQNYEFRTRRQTCEEEVTAALLPQT